MPATDREASPVATTRGSAPVVVVSCDTHIGPLLEEQLRDYCPAEHLDAFDELVAAQAVAAGSVMRLIKDDGALEQLLRNRRTDGHHDVHARIRDMDRDGVAAWVIYHGSLNDQPIPWQQGFTFNAGTDTDRARLAVGQHMYNRWLADFVSVEPERQIGCAQLPMWDVEAAVAELEWAAGAGLRSVNFMAPRPGLLPYNVPEWEPFWAACIDLDMTLSCHGGAGDVDSWTGPEMVALFNYESGGWPSRRAIQFMVFGGVFERHPELKLVLAEQAGEWWCYTQRELDSVWHTTHRAFADKCPRRPSEYLAENVFIGGSFLADFEAAAAVRDGYADHVLWGSDYPHPEGTYQYPDPDETVPMTHLAMRNTFADVAEDQTRLMAGENAIRVYGLDGDALRRVAARINAPTAEELATPIDRIPDHAGLLAFRQIGPWG
jgi:predicted TIM-barrel fold metal-dependent hydrolase